MFEAYNRNWLFLSYSFRCASFRDFSFWRFVEFYLNIFSPASNLRSQLGSSGFDWSLQRQLIMLLEEIIRNINIKDIQRNLFVHLSINIQLTAGNAHAAAVLILCRQKNNPTCYHISRCFQTP